MTPTRGKRYQTVVITGASSGLGTALARQLTPQTHHMLLTARRESDLKQLAAKLPTQTRVLAADICNTPAFQGGLKKFLNGWPAPDLLILNAGIGRASPSATSQLDIAREIYAVNLMGAIAALDVVIPMMTAANRGRIVGISSVVSYRGLPGSAAYCSSKAALWRYLESIRCQMAPSPIRVTTIHPGFVDTPMTQENSFKMPFLMAAEPAAKLMVRAIQKGRAHYAFPWQYRWLARFLRIWPDGLFARLFAREPASNSTDKG